MTQKLFRFFICAAIVFALEAPLLGQSGERAQVSIRRRAPAFDVPPILRARVNFWIDIFTKYGKYQIVVHHRDFPQIVFRVLDFSKAAENLNPVELARLRKRIEIEKVAEVSQAMKNLASGASPSNPTEEFIERQMRNVPGGNSKYKKILDDDLIRTQTGIKEKFEEAVKRTGKYLGIMERIFVEEYGLPVELTRLPFIESSFDYTAYSSVGAAGIWQFMRSTGKKYLTIGPSIDERLDPIIATRAAAQYLRAAHNSLGTWPLAIVSYNHGVAGVYRKMKQAGTNDLGQVIENKYERVFGFASTNFYPEFLAALDVYENYHTYFPNLVLDPPLRYKEHRIVRPTSVGYVLKTLKVEKEDLQAANYALLPVVWQGRRPIPAGTTLRIPLHAEGDLSSLNVPEPEPVSGSARPASVVHAGASYKVKKGDTLKSIAKKNRTSVDVLMRVNGLTSQILKVGQIITLKEQGIEAPESKPEKKVSSAPEPKVKPVPVKEKPAKEQPKSTRIHVVKSGESLWSISRQYKIDLKKLQKANGIGKGGIKPGLKLKIPS